MKPRNQDPETQGQRFEWSRIPRVAFGLPGAILSPKRSPKSYRLPCSVLIYVLRSKFLADSCVVFRTYAEYLERSTKYL